MDIQNPFRHFPRYSLKVSLKTGEAYRKRGSTQKVVVIPTAEEDVLVMVLEALDAGGNSCGSRMWVDGIWSKYSEAEVDRLLNPPVPDTEPDDDPEEVEVDVETDVVLGGEVGYEVVRGSDNKEAVTEEDEEDYEDEEDSRYGLGCG